MTQDSQCPECSGPLREVGAGKGRYFRCYACKPARAKTGETRQCLHCRSTLYVTKQRSSQGFGLYCSRECRISAKGVTAPEGFKHCLMCSTVKPLDDFARSTYKADGRQPRCRACCSVVGAKHRSRPEVERALFDKHLQRKYGISLADYEEMRNYQGDGCAICGGPPNGPGTANGRFDVDHCHDTGKVRGLLCSACNRGIGYLGDDAERVRRAADYLAQYNK